MNFDQEKKIKKLRIEAVPQSIRVQISQYQTHLKVCLNCQEIKWSSSKQTTQK